MYYRIFMFRRHRPRDRTGSEPLTRPGDTTRSLSVCALNWENICPRPGGIKRWCCLTSVCLSDVCRVHPVGGRRVRPAGWMARIGWSGPARPAWLKAAAVRFRCRPGWGHIVAAARLQLVLIIFPCTGTTKNRVRHWVCHWPVTRPEPTKSLTRWPVTGRRGSNTVSARPRSVPLG